MQIICKRYTGRTATNDRKVECIDRYNESIMIGLRASWGVSLKAMERNLGLRYRKHLEEQAKRFIDEGLLHIENNAIKTTEVVHF